MNLIVEKYSFNSAGISDIDKVMTFKEFKSIIVPPLVFGHLFKYKNVTFCTYSIDSETNLFITFFVLRLFAKKHLYFLDKNGEITIVSNRLIAKFGVRFFLNFFQKFILIFRINKKIKSLSSHKKIKFNRGFDYKRRALYLRTDLWFGVKSGGSVGHIAGVLNNLFIFFDVKPLFFSTDIIPTVDKTISTNQLLLPTDYWDYSELPTIASNLSFIHSFDNLSIEDVSLIYQRYSINNFLGVELACKFNLPLIIEFNGSEVWISKNWGKPLKYEKLSKKIEFLVLDKADLIVVVSDPIKNDLIKFGICSDKILVNPNGVDPNVYRPDLDVSILKKNLGLSDKIVIGFIGTFGPWHGAEILAEAFCLLLENNPELKNSIHLLMIGDGTRIGEVKKIVADNGVDEFVTFSGIIPQTEGPSYLATCDILVSPHVPNIDGTPFFGSPTKLFEYMSMAKGIVASDLDQIGEILEHNKTALLVKPGNVIELASGIKKLILDKNLRDELGINARNKIIESYSWEIHTKKIFNRLSEII